MKYKDLSRAILFSKWYSRNSISDVINLIFLYLNIRLITLLYLSSMIISSYIRFTPPRIGPSLFQIMACTWSVPSNYLDQSQRIVIWPRRKKKLPWKRNRRSNIFVQEKVFASVVCKNGGHFIAASDGLITLPDTRYSHQFVKVYRTPKWHAWHSRQDSLWLGLLLSRHARSFRVAVCNFLHGADRATYIQSVYIIISKNILGNRGAWRSLNNTHLTFLDSCIRCTDRLWDSCRLTHLIPHFKSLSAQQVRHAESSWLATPLSRERVLWNGVSVTSQ